MGVSNSRFDTNSTYEINMKTTWITSASPNRTSTAMAPENGRTARRALARALGLGAACLLASTGQAQNAFIQHNLVSDLPGLADVTDTNLVNPWGISFSATSPFWISDNGPGLSTVYNSTGAIQSLVVTIPPPPANPAPRPPAGPLPTRSRASWEAAPPRRIFCSPPKTAPSPPGAAAAPRC